VFGNKTLDESKKKLLVTATAADRFEHRLFSNIERIGTDGKLKAVEVALASAAAPTYFPPVKVSPGERTYLDGGLWANSPCLLSILVSHFLLDIPYSEIKVLSIDTGHFPAGASNKQLKRLRPLSISTVRAVLDSISGAQASFSDEYARNMLEPEHFIKVDTQLQRSMSLDNVQAALEILPPLAEREASTLAPQIRRAFFDEAQYPNPDIGARRSGRPSHARLSEMISASGLNAFYPSRDYYRVYRSTSSIDTYVSTATASVVMVSINLMTGVPFDGLCETLERKLVGETSFRCTISLIDPDQEHLMKSLAPVLNMSADALAQSIRESLGRLCKMKDGLVDSSKNRFSIRVHSVIPLGSAILLDHMEPNGRIQIETKVYKAPFSKSFAFEVGRDGSSDFYSTIAKGYEDLVNDGREYCAVGATV
jgi:peptidoglycan hydrolase-like protein with peptidoglycan-binding domain